MNEARSGLGPEEALSLLSSGADALGARTAGPCPDANALAALADGACADEARVAIETHLSLCAGCRRVVAAIVAAGPHGADSGGASGENRADAGPRGDAPAFPREFGPYVLLARLGGGGMGDVFVAEHRGRGRREALKQVRAGLDDAPRTSERFVREIRAAAGVLHENVVPLLDSGTADGVAYYTMPLLPGPSLAGLLQEIRDAGEAAPGAAACAVLDAHGIPASEVGGDRPEVAYARRVAAVCAGVARALAAIHRAGMVHRDVKPSNVVLDGRGRALLTDFGLVRFDASRITQATERIGTPAYMAPEQFVADAPVDGRADVYGLGATLFEMLTLRRPFEGATLAETVARIVRGDPPRTLDANPHVPRDVSVIVGRCLERDPADRPADADALARDLDAFAHGGTVDSRPVPAVARAARAVARRKVPVMITAAVLAALATGVHFVPGHVTIRSVPTSRILLDGQEIGTTPLRERSVAAADHRIELRCERFMPAVRSFSIGRGGTYDLDVVLRPLDPADPGALELLAAARGVERADVDVAVDRSPSPAGRLAVLLPRGALRVAPTEVSIWAEEPASDVTVRLEPAGAPVGGAAVHVWDVATAFGQVRLEVPEDVRRTIAPGSYRLAIAAGGKAGMSADFDVLPESESRRIQAGLDAVVRGFEPGDEAASFLAADRLVADRLYVEALAVATRLRQSVGDRREVARIVLSALDRAGLRDVGPWSAWAETYLRAQR